MKTFCTIILGTMIALNTHASTQTSIHISSTPVLAGIHELDEPGENKKDPAYKTYKEGYDAVLDERWDNAIKKFAEVASKYPKSEYLDDAEYWTAYALSHTNRKKAVAAYKEFIHKYPKSSYVDDVLADLGDLEQTVTISTSGDSNHIVVSSSGNEYSYTVAPTAKLAETQMRKAEALMRKQMNVHAFKLDRLRIPPMATFRRYEVEKADPETKLKMEALYAIGESTNDEKAFQALKEVALDRKQPLLLRNAALETLTEFKKFDILSIYVDLAKTDTSEKIQSAALEYIAEGSKDKNKSVEVLTNLFNTTPKHRSGQLQTVLYVIADIGNDKAVDFLSTVARTHEDYELRSDAVYYLGTIGGERARAALYQVLRSK
jgi:hypothetical protein